MKIIISPTKKMKYVENDFELSCPEHIKETQKILKSLKEKNYSELKTIWKCNDTIAKQNYERIYNMDLYQRCSPAILTYDGIVFKNINPETYTKDELNNINEKLRILSGFYGILKPLDGIVPYRLEMQSQLKISNYENLYEFWKDKLYKSVEGPILNLASKEYSKTIEKYLGDKDKYVTCNFFELVNGEPMQKGTYVKMARGKMVNYIVKNNIQSIEDVKKFNADGYKFSKEASTDSEYIFYR